MNDSRTATRRVGPVYDDAMRALADDDTAALLHLAGVPAGEIVRRHGDLPAHTIHADLVVALSSGGVVHMEYVMDATPDLDLRMVDYRVRLRRRDRTGSVRQFVLALGDVDVPERYTDVDEGMLTCSWTVVRTRDINPARMLAFPSTAPLAALGRGTADERAAALTAAADLILAVPDPERRTRLLAAATTLASIVLSADTIDSALKEATMPVPVRDTPLGRLLLDEGREEGREEGRRFESTRLTALMLRRRFGLDPRIDGIAEALAELPDEERMTAVEDAASLDDLDPSTRDR